jgi:hypothetical protein
MEHNHSVLGLKELMDIVREEKIPCRKHNVPACEECTKLLESNHEAVEDAAAGEN